MLDTLILTGGGMRCAWSAGFLYGLNEIGIRPKTIIASSGNTGNAVYFATNQTQSTKRIWTQHLPGKHFISFLRWKKIIDIDYLVDDVFAQKEPLDFERLLTSETQVICLAFNVHTHQFEPFTNRSITYDVLRATKALPFIYGKTVPIGTGEYSDYPISPALMERFASNSSHILTIDIRSSGGLFDAVGKYLLRRSQEPEMNSRAQSVIRPAIDAHLLTRSQETLTKIFEEGRKYCHEYFKKDMLESASEPKVG